MPRYYFDLRDEDGLTTDLDGLVLVDIHAAREEAARTLSDLARDEIRRRMRHQSNNHIMAIDVRDDDGPLVEVKFAITIINKRLIR